MKKNTILNKILFLTTVFCMQFSFAQEVTIKSLSELKSYFSQDNITAVMTPGTYVINSTITVKGNLFPDPIMFEFTGSNSTYDFTGVTFELNTEILNDY